MLRILLILPDQNVSVIFVNNIYIGNVRIVWHTKLYMKTWYSSLNVYELPQFFLNFGPKCYPPNTPKPKNTPGDKMS